MQVVYINQEQNRVGFNVCWLLSENENVPPLPGPFILSRNRHGTQTHNY